MAEADDLFLSSLVVRSILPAECMTPCHGDGPLQELHRTSRSQRHAHEQMRSNGRSSGELLGSLKPSRSAEQMTALNMWRCETAKCRPLGCWGKHGGRRRVQVESDGAPKGKISGLSKSLYFAALYPESAEWTAPRAKGRPVIGCKEQILSR